MKKLLCIIMASLLIVSPIYSNNIDCKIKIFEENSKEKLEAKTNEFIKNKDIINISYSIGQTSNSATEWLFNIQNLKVVYSCLITYKES